MHRNPSVNVHQFAMVPRADIPRSRFAMQKTLKTTFDAGYLVPIFCEEALPGDTFNVRATLFARLATPIFPFMDNLHLETFFFWVPNRLTWSNWVKFMGEQANPGDSISFTVPRLTSAVGGYAIGSVFDYFGLPTVGQMGGGNTQGHNVLPLRAYNLIYNQWFRDQNLQNSVTINTGDAGDLVANYALLRRGKRHDYFTSCLPFVQKGTAVTLPLGTAAPVYGTGKTLATWDGVTPMGLTASATFLDSRAAEVNTAAGAALAGAATVSRTLGVLTKAAQIANFPGNTDVTGLYADLSTATAATINQLRQSFQIQRLLERDARGGTRYVEIIRAHFGTTLEDYRAARPVYLGGGYQSIAVNPVAQTSATGVTGGATPAGTLAGMAQSVGRHGFTQSFTEHGYIIGLVNVRADLTYQQGLRRHWNRQTRYDYYFPAFAHLGEQAVLNMEIYCDGSANDNLVFGYQSRWDEYRYNPSEITGLFRSTAAGTIDPWHLAQRFTGVPTLNATFISDTPPVSRVVAVGAAANGQQFLLDAFYDMKVARPLPMYSVPGLVDHF